MTIVQPYKKISFSFFLFLGVSAMIGVTAVIGIILYNGLVDLRHDVAEVSQSIQKAEVQNAELKNNLYAMVDPQNPEILLRDRGLVEESRPQYRGSGEGRRVSGL